MDTFGESVTHTPADGGDAQTVTGVFANQHVAVLQGGVEVVTTRPTLGIKLSDFDSEPVQGDTLTINSVTYKVSEVDKDGEGGATLILHRAS